MARYGDEPGQQLQEEMDDAEGSETEDESEGAKGKTAVRSKGKSRRKACEKPEGSDQKRQAFSKRKRGLILKSYQLYKLTDARVFVFIVNDKGSSWAYASPGFAKTLSNAHLMQMREYAQLTGNQRTTTEIMPHPNNDAEDRRIDDRQQVLRANQSPAEAAAGPGPNGVAATAAPTASGGGGGGRNAPSTCASQQQQPLKDVPSPSAAAVMLPPGSAGGLAARRAAFMAAAAAASAMARGDGGLAPADHPADGPREGGRAMGRAGPNSSTSNKMNFRVQTDEGCPLEDEPMHDVGPPPGARGSGAGPDSIITPSGRRMAAAVGIALPGDAGGVGSDGGGRDDMEQDMLPPAGPRSGGAGPGSGLAVAAAAALAGLPPSLKQARHRDSGGNNDSGGPPPPHAPAAAPPPPSLPRGRRMEPLPVLPPHPHQHQQQRRVPGPGGLESPGREAGGHHSQSGGPPRTQLPYSHQQQQQMGGPEEDEPRQLHLAPRGGGCRPPSGQPPPPPPPPLPPATSRPTAPGSYATGYVQPGFFSYGQVVKGSDGQLYRVVGELDEGEAPVMEEGVTDKGAAQVLMSMPQAFIGSQAAPVALQSGGGGGSLGRMAYGGHGA